MPPLHDWCCNKCGYVQSDCLWPTDKHPECPRCEEGEMYIYFGSGQAPAIIGPGGYVPDAARNKRRAELIDSGVRKRDHKGRKEER